MAFDFKGQLLARVRLANIPSPSAADLDKLEAYFDLLVHWNRKINLTSLPLEPPTDQAIDRLFVESLAAAPLVGRDVTKWYDLGSGGGSPAIPLQIVRAVPHLLMVESRERKAAFLSEVTRQLDLRGAYVLALRIESLVEDHRRASSADLITVRAVKLSAPLFSQLDTLLRVGGQAILFGAGPQRLQLPRGLYIQYVEPPLLIARKTNV
jgi:16S rRNA (guanine(527)-N(7))-methyltransferase RsmG